MVAQAQEQPRGLLERRERARSLAATPAQEHFDEVLELLVDRDALTRARAVGFLTQVELGDPDSRARRIERLASGARVDASAEVRRACLGALAELATPAAARALFELLEDLPRPERGAAARLLVERVCPRSGPARELLEETVRASFGELGIPLQADLLAIFLPAYAKHLAEREGGGDQARERAPIVLGARHPSEEVREAAQAALVTFLGRLRELERFDRAGRALEHFAQDGVPTQPLLYLRVLSVLEEGGLSPEVALEGARSLARSSAEADGWAAVRWRGRAALLEAVALIALDRLDPAAEALQRAADLFDGSIARRAEHSGKLGAERQRELHHERALVEFTEVFRRVAGGAAADDPSLLQRLRNAHGLQLTAQLVARGADLPASDTLDPFFDSTLSPYRLVFAQRPHAAWPPARAIALRLALGRALASVSRRELPGFEPFPDNLCELFDSQPGDRREGLLNRIAQADLLALQRELERLRLRQLREIDRDPALESEIALLSFAWGRALVDLREKPLAERFYDLRRPSASALNLADALRREGRNEESRALATRLYEALEAEELRQKFTWAVRLAAQAQLAIGGSWSDADQPRRAQEHMQRGLELLDGLRKHFEERRAAEAARALDGEISEALVSLAVNANVKAGDPEGALGFFERAYELRQDDFMRVMLACYRARSGRAEEARALLREVPTSPRGYYNLACTYALLGEDAAALDLLERDFDENRRSRGALEKQKEWARGDPDLASLRDDPRFQWLTAPSAEPETGAERSAED
jgi:hypothetical protein